MCNIFHWRSILRFIFLWRPPFQCCMKCSWVRVPSHGEGGRDSHPSSNWSKTACYLPKSCLTHVATTVLADLKQLNYIYRWHRVHTACNTPAFADHKLHLHLISIYSSLKQTQFFLLLCTSHRYYSVINPLVRFLSPSVTFWTTKRIAEPCLRELGKTRVSYPIITCDLPWSLTVDFFV